jgi:hypothetical protein
LAEVTLLIEVQVTTYVVVLVVVAVAVAVAAVLLGVFAMFVVFVAVFDYIVVLQSAVVVREGAQGAGEFPALHVCVLHHMNHVETLVSSVKLEVFGVLSHTFEVKIVGLGWDCLWWMVHTGLQVQLC